MDLIASFPRRVGTGVFAHRLKYQKYEFIHEVTKNALPT